MDLTQCQLPQVHHAHLPTFTIAILCSKFQSGLNIYQILLPYSIVISYADHLRGVLHNSITLIIFHFSADTNM